MNANEIFINSTPTTNQASSSKDYLINRNSNFTQIKFLGSVKNYIKVCNSISLNSSQFLFTVLSYKLSPVSYSTVVKEITKNTEKNKNLTISSSKNRLKLTKNKCIKLKLSKPLPSRFSFKSQNMAFYMKNSSSLISTSEIFENFSLTRCLADFKSDKNFYFNHDKFVLFSIFKELQKRRVANLTKQGSFIRFDEVNKDFSFTRVIKVQISLAKHILSVSLKPMIRLPTLMSESDPSDFFTSQEGKECIKRLNQLVLTGKFAVFEKTFVYQTKFLASEVTKVNMSTHLLIKKDLDLVFHYLPFIEETISDCSTQAETLEIKFKDLEVQSNQVFAMKEVKLLPEDYEREKKLKEILGTTSQDLFIANRLLHRKIVFSADFVVLYPINSKGEKFESFAHESPKEAIDSIFYLSDELLKLNLKFKNNRFPFNSFNWYEEKPIYSYDLPLFELLEISESCDLKKKVKKNSENSESEESSDSFDEVSEFKKNFFFDILDFHSLSLESKTQFFSPSEAFTVYQSVDFIPLQKHVAIERNAIYESNNTTGVIKYRGICKSGENVFLLSEKRNLTPVLITFEKKGFDFQLLRKFSADLLKIIEIITLKNTSFTCFDPKCVFFKDNGKIRIEIKTSAEVSDEFKAPEVKLGRFFRFSIVFSFAKVVEFAFCYYFCISHGLLPEPENLMRAKSLVYQEFSWFGDFVRGCCEEKIVKRWNVSKLVQYFSSHLGMT